MRFLSTPSARRATGSSSHRPCRCRYFYPRPPRGGRPRPLDNDNGLTNISIHALREEGDLNNLLLGDIEVISIHALREEGDRTILPMTAKR